MRTDKERYGRVLELVVIAIADTCADSEFLVDEHLMLIGHGIAPVAITSHWLANGEIDNVQAPASCDESVLCLRQKRHYKQ